MPTYEYECDACGHQFEIFQPITAKTMRKCPECKKSKLQRLVGTGAGIIFKGSGFYETDYRSESYKQAAKKDSEASKSSSGESKGDTKSKSDAPKTSAPKNESNAKTDK